MVEGESVDNQLTSGDLIKQIQLERYGDGFLYSAPPANTPTPSPEPTPKPVTFPATLVFVASVGIALAVIGLLVHFKKRK